VYLIERFDREVGRRASGVKSGPARALRIRRRHVIDACQLLNKDRLFKHVGATLDSLAAIIDRATNTLVFGQSCARLAVC
jgi:serine/threonine-protein kinase HipA